MRVFLAGTASRKWVLHENLSCRWKREEPDSFENARKRERDGDAAGVADENISCRRSSVEGGARQNI